MKVNANFPMVVSAATPERVWSRPPGLADSQLMIASLGSAVQRPESNVGHLTSRISHVLFPKVDSVAGNPARSALARKKEGEILVRRLDQGAVCKDALPRVNIRAIHRDEYLRVRFAWIRGPPIGGYFYGVPRQAELALGVDIPLVPASRGRKIVESWGLRIRWRYFSRIPARRRLCGRRLSRQDLCSLATRCEDGQREHSRKEK